MQPTLGDSVYNLLFHIGQNTYDYANSSQLPLLVFMGGQSNMAGFGTTGNDVPAALLGAMADVYYWRDLEPSGAPSYGWALYNAGVNSEPTERTTPQKWGPEAEFARQFRLAHPARQLFIVKNSLSGAQLENTDTFIDGGTPENDWHPSSVGELYDGTESMLASAMATLPGLGVTSYNTLVLWMQGETDSAYTETASTYYTNWTLFINSLRSEWGLGSSVPVIAGRTTIPSWTYNGPVRMAFARVAAGDLSNVKMINTDDLELLGDNIHYSANGQQGMGERFYKSYAGTLSTTPILLPSTFSWTIEEQQGNGTAIGTITPSNTPNPSATFEFLSGETTGFALNQNTGALTVGDGTQLVFASDASRVFVVRASNGINTVTTTVTVTLTESEEVTDIVGRLARFDPDNATFYSLDGSNYDELSDTYGDGNEVVQSIGGKPVQGTFPSTSRDAMNPDGGDALYRDPSDTLFDDTHENAVLACVCHPTTGPSGAKIIMGVLSGFAECRLTLFYEYTTTQFGFHALNTLGTLNTMYTTNTFAADATYRVVLKKAGSSLTIWVNEVEQGTSDHGSISETILSSSQTGGFTIAGQGIFGGEFVGYIGLLWFIRGNPSVPEMAFLNDDLSGWLV